MPEKWTVVSPHLPHNEPAISGIIKSCGLEGRLRLRPFPKFGLVRLELKKGASDDLTEFFRRMVADGYHCRVYTDTDYADCRRRAGLRKRIHGGKISKDVWAGRVRRVETTGKGEITMIGIEEQDQEQDQEVIDWLSAYSEAKSSAAQKIMFSQLLRAIDRLIYDWRDINEERAERNSEAESDDV